MFECTVYYADEFMMKKLLVKEVHRWVDKINVSRVYHAIVIVVVNNPSILLQYAKSDTEMLT